MSPIIPGGHFFWSELACHDGSPYPGDWRADRLPVLLRALEDVRAECGAEKGREVPLLLSSLYRTPAYQAMLLRDPVYRAAKHSQHVQGRAADICCPRELNWDAFEMCVKRACARPQSPIRYVEYRPSQRYVHIDTRPTQRLVEETVP